MRPLVSCLLTVTLAQVGLAAPPAPRVAAAPGASPVAARLAVPPRLVVFEEFSRPT